MSTKFTFFPKTKGQSSESGQTFLEFVFLLVMLMGLGVATLVSFNGGIREYWQASVKLISHPTQTPINIP